MISRWTLVFSPQYQDWLQSLEPQQVRAIGRKLELLRMQGPLLGRPHVDHVKGSQYPNLKELRITSGSPLRILFCFDEQRQGVVLIGGDKSTRNDWYTVTIQQAEKIFAEHVRSSFKNDESK